MLAGRRLTLKREILAELDAVDLHLVAGGAPPTRNGCEIATNTCFSCLTYISCNPLACLVVRPSVADCVEVSNTC